MKQTCSKCRTLKPIEEFSFRFKEKEIRHVQCRECVRSTIKSHYTENRSYYLTKAQKRNNNYRELINTYIYQYLSQNPCVDCGESDVTVLEFDHRDRMTKIQAVSQLIRSQYPLEKIKEEISKCDVRCANCHRRKTAKEFNWFKK